LIYVEALGQYGSLSAQIFVIPQGKLERCGI
jgi:hypothetical protein